MEDEIYDHVSHKHPLSRVPDSARKGENSYVCYGCWRAFLPGEATYGCSRRCGFEWLLHKECMEMPREIMHPFHPSHSLTLALNHSSFKKCAVCEGTDVAGLGYRCSQACDGFWIHMECSEGFEDKDERRPPLAHPSHPQHELRFSKKTRWCPFPCDACGATERGDSYICTLCDYWIHESCALLPSSADFPRHRHSLSLAFSTPREYILNRFDCGVCNTTLPLTRWVYHCHLCSYVVHLNCATSTFVDGENEDAKATDDEKEVTKFPIAVDDMYEEMIRPFVKRQRGQIFVPRDHSKYSFSNHPHRLTFTTFSSVSSSSSSSSQDHYKKNEEDYDEDDFDSILTCDGCTLPIQDKKQTDDEYEHGYMNCNECKYFLHLSCFNLPLFISSLPIHPLKDHNLMLRNAGGKLASWVICYICRSDTNGIYYACTYEECKFIIDIKCASLPNTIKHAAHPRHNYLKLVTDYDFRSGFCENCYWPISQRKEQYICNSCRFCVCGNCVMLPARNKHRLENHALALTYDAYARSPGDFYCSSCEFKMISRRIWMYHCRDCDQSFHPKCFPATSGKYRNINFGTRQYMISSIHDHPLRFQIISKKKRCDLCRDDGYDQPGFQCASCFFVVCKSCGLKHMHV